MKFVLASKNPKKLIEMRSILERLNIEAVMQHDVGLDLDVTEDGATFEENALKKARAVMEASGLPAVADDSGLEVNALNGEPGIYSARYGGAEAADDEARTKLLLRNMEHVPDDKRAAGFVSCICCVFPDGRTVTARGECEGIITSQPRGTGGFGYDPVFFLPEYGMTMAELSPEIKNKISHRAKAINEFGQKLECELGN